MKQLLKLTVKCLGWLDDYTTGRFCFLFTSLVDGGVADGPRISQLSPMLMRIAKIICQLYRNKIMRMSCRFKSKTLTDGGVH